MLGKRLAVVGWSLIAAWPLMAQSDAFERCAVCHPEEVAGYLETGMGRSISRAAEVAPGGFDHAVSGSAFQVTATESGSTESGSTESSIVQRVERDGLSAEYPVEYVIGSGNAAFGYLIRVGNHIYQSPIAYYTKRGVWDMAPGMESHPAPDFNRPVLPECLWCHAGRPLPVPQTQNQYRDPILAVEAISCDRCHGTAESHLAKPSAETILNPAKLPAAKRNTVCEQCHLSGQVRVLNPGKGFGDFLPGMELEEVFSVYTKDNQKSSEAPGSFKVVSHFEQLALSQCSARSGDKMWCGTCHNPHDKPAEPIAYYRERCLSCHGPSLLETHAEPADDCVSCHMSRRHSRDSGHSAFTDHFISRRPRTEGLSEPAGPLRAWREPRGALARRNLGLAYLEVGQREQINSYLDEGSSLLAQVVQSSSGEPVVLSALGSVLMLRNDPAGPDLKPLALQMLADAVRREPQNAEYYRTEAAAWWQLGSRGKAIALLNQAIELDPPVESAYRVLARIYEESRQPGLARQTWERYLEVMPQSLQARSELRRLGAGESKPGSDR